MSEPITPDQLIKALVAEGIAREDIVEMPGWRSHNRNHKGSWGDVHGGVIHHTAGVGSGMANFCYNGSAELPGPLCHQFLSKAGKLYMVGNGRTNHAGTVAANAYEAILNEEDWHPRPDASEPIDGNAKLYGIEIENKGDRKDPYPWKQYVTAVLWATAIARFHGWGADSFAGHAEVTRRKTDPSFSMETFRTDVAFRLRHAVPGKPGGHTGLTNPPARYHTVDGNDTVSSIARETGVSVDQLGKLNGWLKVGSKVRY